MTINKVYTKSKTKFSDRIEQWCQHNSLEFDILDKEDRQYEEIDSLVIFHEDHNLDDTAVDIRDNFEKKLRPIHMIDINGTKQVISSHYLLWLERNSCKNVLFVGNDRLIENPGTEMLLEKMV